MNYRKEVEWTNRVPSDGVWWVEREHWLQAERVTPGGPADRAGIKVGDVLNAINNRTVNTSAALTREMFKTGAWRSANYSVARNDVPLDVPVILEPADKSLNLGLRLIALTYLVIGLYVLLRRWTAPKSTHFYLFCLVSFAFYSFKYVGNWSVFDQTIYWCNVGAWLLQPALFLHFALTFPEPREFLRRRPWLVAGVYAPGAALLALHIVILKKIQASELLRWNVDRLEMLYLVVLFAIAAVVLWQSYRRAQTPVLRQQMKWVTRGTILAITPFTLFYVIPYLAGALPTTAMKVSAFSLVFLPLTFGYAIVRYRLMDVDLIFKRGVVYTLAAAAIIGLYYGFVALVAELIHINLPSTGPLGLIVAVIATALLFDPLKNYTQQRLDRVFYKKRYDYRRTLIEFGRDLSSETDVDHMLSSVLDRLARTLMVDRVAVFVAAEDQPGRFTLGKSYGISFGGELDLSFLTGAGHTPETRHLFFDNTQNAMPDSPGARQTIARLDLNYYIPCSIQGRIIAVLGLGKTMEGDFLSSEDVELLETLAGYLGIAIQNARLYASLEQKVTEYERLKDFNENIVESISVGVLAVDLADRIEFWNSQMEVMYALPRAQAVGQPLSTVFPAAFAEEFYRVRPTAGIHNLYKFRMETSAGDTRITNVAIAPLVTKKFQVVGRLIIVDDITERIDLESQLTQAEKMSSIGLLAAGVAHEVNTPLAVISSYAQMLSKQVQDDEKKSALLEKITRQTFRASEIVNNLLNFSRTSGTEFGAVSLNKVIKDTLTLLEHQLKTSRIKVQDELADDLPAIHGNAGKLQQVFLNLFLNARDAMPSGGTLTVATSNGSSVQVLVADTGSGIAQEHIHRIYDPFFTTKNGTQGGQPRGTGLGLAVTYGIIQEHAGKIRVESQPGEGTRFYLQFPMTRKAVHV
ncbi:MAG TPA: ATP-binding protein, partial [Terriglobales bacterium]|nr:ATP-binding protein [Terriglobales bacterium]